MGWEDLLSESSGRMTAPWLGGRRIYSGSRAWRVDGDLPREFGLYEWVFHGRKAACVSEAKDDHSYAEGWESCKGYLIGDRFIHVEFPRCDIDELLDLSQPVFLVEPGLDRFTFVQVVRDPERRHIYLNELFPLGPEDAVRRAFIDRKESVNDVPEVTPALDLAFRFATRQRQILEERRAELERRRAEERRREEMLRNMGTAMGRRAMAAQDFDAAARAALAVGNAELLDVRQGRTRREVVVQFRMEGRRFECVAERETLRIIDSGICLEDHHTHERGDTYFTLESLPGVIRQAIREDRLVVYRHVDGYNDWED